MTDVRNATPADVDAMVTMIERYRGELERWRSDFWRKAERSAETSRLWFGHLIASPDKAHALVAEEEEAVTGFLIATPIATPPVYAAQGTAWTVDDFCVAGPERWVTAGRALWDAIVAHGRAAGWGQLICVSPVADDAKNAMLEETMLRPTSRWWSQAL